MSNLIGTGPNQVPTNGMLGTMAFVDAVDSITSTATTSTTLTSTATLLQITPSSYGVAVTLPDATTCTEGGPLHIIDNKGAYPVRMLNSAGTLLGFVYGGVVSHVSLSDNSTAAGTWTIENNELVGASAQLLTTNLVGGIGACLDLGSSREFILASGAANSAMYGVVYDRSTNTFGSATLIRTAASQANRQAAVIVSTDKILVVSTDSATAFEAVVLSISGTTITVNTAATATLSAAMTGFADGCGLIAVGSSFVCSYTVSGPAAQIRALSISGTTVTIGSASVLDGTVGGQVYASTDKVVAFSAVSGTNEVAVKPYAVSGSTLSAGTGTLTAVGGVITALYVASMSTGRWVTVPVIGAGGVCRAVVSSLSGTTITTSAYAQLFSAGTVVDVIIVGSTKVLALNNQTANNANILTDTAGTASAGTAISLSSQTARACLYVSGTDVVVGEGAASNPVYIQVVSCSGASPVLSQTLRMDNGNSTVYSTAPFSNSNSNSVLSKNPNLVFGTTFAQQLFSQAGAWTFLTRARGFSASLVTSNYPLGANFSARYRGKSDSERWVTDAATVITKIECVT